PHLPPLHAALPISRHLLEDIGGVADLPPGERRVSHRAHQLVDGSAFGQIQRKHRPEFVFYWIVEHSPGHSFLSLLRHRFSSKEMNPARNPAVTRKRTAQSRC